MEYILVMETSSSSAKVLLYNQRTGKHQMAQQPLGSEINDGKSHDSDPVFQQVLKLATGLVDNEKERRGVEVLAIHTIVMVTTWHSFTLMSHEGKALSRTLLWSALLEESLDGETIHSVDAYERTGCNQTMIYPVNKWRYLTQKGQPLENYGANSDVWVGDQASYNFYQLTGYYETSSNMASGTGFYNLLEETYDEAIVMSSGLKREQLPVVRDGYRNIRREMADELGIHHNVKVYTPVSDGGMNQYYYGNSANGIMSASIGTSGAIRSYVSQPILSEKHLWCYRLGNGYILGAAIAGAGNLVKTYRELLFPEIELNELESTMKDMEISPRTPYLFMPFELGERNPGFRQDHLYGFYDEKGHKVDPKSYQDMSLNKRLELAVALLEGILFNLYQCYQYLIKTDVSVKRIRLSGGILHSPMWVQMFADIFQEPVYTDEQTHASVFGGLYYALHRNGLPVPSDDEGEQITPNKSLESQDYYMEKYRRYLEYYATRTIPC